MANVISPVGSFQSKATSTTRTASLTPTAVGNAWILWIAVGSTAVTINSVTGGNATWVPLSGTITLSSSRYFVYIGTIDTAAGVADTVTVDFSINGFSCAFFWQEFTTGGGAGTVWSADGSVALSNNTGSSTSIAYPTLVPANAHEMYVGIGFGSSNCLTTGQTAGYTAQASAGGAFMWDADVSTSQSPITKQTSSGTSVGVGMLVYGTNAPQGAASLAATAGLTAAGTPQRPGAVALSGAGALATVPVQTDAAGITMSAAAVLATAPTQGIAVAVALNASAALTSIGGRVESAGTALAGATTLNVGGDRVVTSAVGMSATAALTAGGSVGSAVKLVAAARLNTAISLVLAPSVALNAASQLLARAVLAFLVPFARPGTTSVQVRANPGFTAVQVRAPAVGSAPPRPIAGLPYRSEVQISHDTGRLNAEVTLAAQASLTVPAGTLRAVSAVALAGAGSLSPTVSGAGATSLAAAGSLAAGAVDTAGSSVNIAATATLVAGAVPATPGAVSMSADSTLTGSATSVVTYPHNMTAVVGSDNSITLTWDAVPGASSYKLYEDQSLTGVSGATALTTTTSVRTPSTLRTYHYWVTATVAGVESVISNKAEAILPYTAPGGGGTGGGTATSFTMGFGSCINAADSNALAVCATMNPDYFVQCGDVYYDDGSSNAASHWDAQFGAPGYSALLNALRAKGPLIERHIYTWSDHEAFANNATGSAFGPLNSAWRSYPAFSGIPVPSNGIYNSFEIGRVLFIKLDERTFKDANSKTDDANKTILGAAQKAWFSNLIATATNALIVIIGDVPITTPTSSGDDSWAGYNTERLWMQGILNGSSATFIRFSGNMHCLAKTSNAYGYDRAWQAAGLNQATTVSAGGTGLGLSYPTNANEGPTLQLFGMVSFTDDGNQITVNFSGYEATSATAKTLRLSDSIVVSAPSGGGTGTGGGTRGTPASILNINGVGTGGGGNWNEGIGFHPGDTEGSTHQDFSYATVAGGYNRTPYFTPNTDGTGVQFQVYCNGGKTSANTHYPRSELRELTAGGSANMSFSGSSGTHKMSGTTRVMHGVTAKDEVVIAQIHDGSDDTLQIVVSGSSILLSVKGTRQSPAALTGYTKGTWFDWAIALTNGVLTVSINGVQKYNSNPGYGSGQYFKTGCYAQAASGYTSGVSATDYFTVELKNLLTSHA